MMDAMADQFTDEETTRIRRAVLGALAYVSKADPGFFASFSESAEGAKALSEAPQDLRELLMGGFVLPERETPEQFDATVVGDLQEAIALVEARDPAMAGSLKQVVSAAVEQVASASKGVSAEEQRAVDEIRGALA